MKAQILGSFGDDATFELVDLPRPAPADDEVVVKVAATSVNPIDLKIRQYGGPAAPELPAVLGCDVAGVVVAVGKSVEQFDMGDEVYGCAGGVRGMNGAYADFIATDPALLALKPQSLVMTEAAALPLVAITAWEGLVDRSRIDDSDNVLVVGGTGGVGHIAVQLAAQFGSSVSAIVSTPEKAALARELGAGSTIEYRSEDVAARVAEITEGRGFDIVFDATGGDALSPLMGYAHASGRIVGIVAKSCDDLSPIHLKGLSYHAVFMPLPMLTGVGRARHGEILRQVAVLTDQGKLRPLLDDESFGLEDLSAAHERLATGKATGKVVIKINA